MRRKRVCHAMYASELLHEDITGIYLHCVQKKTSTYVFDCNSGICWSIFILFIAMETGINKQNFFSFVPQLVTFWGTLVADEVEK